MFKWDLLQVMQHFYSTSVCLDLQYACKHIHRLSHTDLIFSVFLPVSHWLSLSHLNPASEARRYLRCFSWVKITFTLTWKGRSIPGVELKCGWCWLLSNIHSHRNLPGGHRFPVYFWAACLGKTSHNHHHCFIELVSYCLTSSLHILRFFMCICKVCTFCRFSLFWFGFICSYHLLPCLCCNLLQYMCMVIGTFC